MYGTFIEPLKCIQEGLEKALSGRGQDLFKAAVVQRLQRVIEDLGALGQITKDREVGVVFGNEVTPCQISLKDVDVIEELTASGEVVELRRELKAKEYLYEDCKKLLKQARAELVNERAKYRKVIQENASILGVVEDHRLLLQRGG